MNQFLKALKKQEYFENFMIRSIKNSNAIEGNTLSYAETYSIVFNDESLPLQNVNPRELYEAINLKYALKYSLDNLAKFDKNLIISIGDLINKNIKDTSGFRKIQNYIRGADFVPVKPEYVSNQVDEIIFEYNNSNLGILEKIAKFHTCFEHIHPFEDGNGRLARILSDMLLARGENSEFRVYNVSSQINKDKNHYYDILERMQHGDGDITEWLTWYLQKLVNALDEADTIVTIILNKSFFWQKASAVPMTERQTQMLNLFLDGYEAKITSKTWATLAKCSKDTAIRDIKDLVDKNILIEDIPGAKRPSYSIVYDAEDLSQFFTEVSISEENGIPYLKAIFKGKKPVSERLLKLDAERFKKGDLPLSNLLSKYCSYIAQSN